LAYGLVVSTVGVVLVGVTGWEVVVVVVVVLVSMLVLLLSLPLSFSEGGVLDLCGKSGYFGDQGPTLGTVHLLESKLSLAYVWNQVKVEGDSPGILMDRL